MRLAWLTDIHLNFVSPDEVSSLAQRIDESGADAVLVGGDIAEADSFADSLRQLSGASNIPHYFVLGNHDYYRGSIATVREEAAALSRESSILRWLPDAGVVQLTDKTALVGHGGWGDGRIGKFFESDVVLNDYALIADGKGVILSGDNLQVVQDRRWLSFMYSYPNFIPLPASAVRRIVQAVEPFEFDRIYGAWWGKVVFDDGKAAVKRSSDRYIRAIED